MSACCPTCLYVRRSRLTALQQLGLFNRQDVSSEGSFREMPPGDVSLSMAGYSMEMLAPVLDVFMAMPCATKLASLNLSCNSVMNDVRGLARDLAKVSLGCTVTHTLSPSYYDLWNKSS